MFRPLAGIITLGALPGIVLGFYLRVLYLPDAAHFKLFVGVVLLYLSWRLQADFFPWTARKEHRPGTVEASSDMTLHIMHVGYQRVVFAFQGRVHEFSTPAMLALAFAVGIIGGTYGIGGGAIIAPFCIAVFRLPVYVVAGAALAGTFVTSIAGVAVYTFLPLPDGGYATPDWWLGSLFGLGGLAGMYLGAACQKHVPQQVLKASLSLLLAGLGGFYLLS